MEVYSPSSDNLYESRSDFVTTVINKRRNYENLQRSIQAHKNRLAMARMKKGKNLPGDDLGKFDGSGCCRQSTADTNDGFEQYRFRRHTQSSLNKINKPVTKYNSLGVGGGFDGKYDNEQLYIRKYDDFQTKMNQSLVRCNTKLQPKLSNKSEFSFDPNFDVNKVDVASDELEKKIVEVLGKLLLKKELKPNLGVLSQQQQLQLDGPKVFQDENHDKVVDLLTKCISTTLNTAANDSLDVLSSARTSKSVNVEINLNMPSTKETEPSLTVNMQDDFVEEPCVFIENVFDKDTKVVKDNVFKDFFGKFKKLYSSENKSKTQKEDKGDRQVFDRKQVKSSKFQGDWNKQQGFQVNGVSNKLVVNQVQPGWVKGQYPLNVQVQNVVQKKVKQVDLEEQKLWNMNGKNDLTRKNSFVGPIFRPFSRSRSQSLHMQQKVDPMKSQGVPVNDSFFQNPGVKIVRRNSGVAPVKKGDFHPGLNLVQQQVGQQPQQQQVYGFNGEQTNSLGVDHTFNPFNLPQPYFNPQNNQVFDEQQVLNQNQKPVGVSMVQRNNRFDTFNKRNGTRGTVGDFQDNLTQRFERNGFGCFDMPVKSRQGTRPKLQRTFNMNKKGWLEPRIFTGQFPQVESAKVLGPPQTPMGFTVMKRINTEPKNFNGLQVQSPSLAAQKQMTGDVKMKVNQPVTRAKLLKTRSVIDTLNQLSKMNNMY